MKTARYDTLAAYVKESGVKVEWRAPSVGNILPDHLVEQSGLPDSVRREPIQAFYYAPGDWLLQPKPRIAMYIRRNTPEWLRVSILAHEFGHHIAWLLGEGKEHGRDYYLNERDASYHGYALLQGLGIKVTAPMRACLNLSIYSHGRVAGRDLAWLKEEAL